MLLSFAPHPTAWEQTVHSSKVGIARGGHRIGKQGVWGDGEGGTELNGVAARPPPLSGSCSHPWFLMMPPSTPPCPAEQCVRRKQTQNPGRVGKEMQTEGGVCRAQKESFTAAVPKAQRDCTAQRPHCSHGSGARSAAGLSCAHEQSQQCAAVHSIPTHGHEPRCGCGSREK